ncbi:CvpA family protein [Lactobacillus delbrueckii]|uniref:CvpA family protein n=1 Tax=Lactobacillus delbrueckii TaxID=1584 RepID=UPI0007398045|nr:CvpA family protein [Lactobacillus delbrueckii]CUS16789.1 Colicin V production protein [Lactobacillus delbrueckii subsp. bulgaricus]
MLLVIFVILYIAWQTYKGYHVGFFKRIVNLIFAGLVFMLAIMLQNPVGNLIYTQFVQGQAGDSSLVLHACRFGAFFALFFILKQIAKIFKAWLPAQETKTGFTATLDHMAGAIVSFVASYFFMYVVLSILNSVGVSQLSQLIGDSQLLSFIVNDTPGLSTGVFKTLFSVSRTTA